MKRMILLVVVALAAAGLVGAFAVNSYAHPAYGQPCAGTGCHAADDPRINTTPGTTTPGQIPTNTPDATCAVAVCDAASFYRGNAVFHLSATDNADGWGIGYVYYKLDGGPVRLVRVPVDWTAGTGTFACESTLTVPAPGTGAESHSLKYWTQDNYGNVSAARTSTFTVNARTAMPMSIATNLTSVYRYRTFQLSGKVSKPGVTVTLWKRNPGSTKYYVYKTIVTSSTGTWSKLYKPVTRGYYYFKVTFAGDTEWLASTSKTCRVYVK